MDEGFDAQPDNFTAHEIGGHGRGSSRVVRECQGINMAVGNSLPGQVQRFILRGFPGASSRNKLPGDREYGGIQ